MKIKLELKWQNVWIGAYWEIKEIVYVFRKPNTERYFHILICIIPCLSIHILWRIK